MPIHVIQLLRMQQDNRVSACNLQKADCPHMQAIQGLAARPSRRTRAKAGADVAPDTSREATDVGAPGPAPTGE